MVDSDQALGARARDEDVALRFLLDRDTMCALIDEAELMDDPDLDDAFRRRLNSGVVNAHLLGPDQLHWRPLKTDATPYELIINARVVRMLDRLSAALQYDRDVIITTILTDGLCMPFEVATRQRRQERLHPKAQVRREPGKGNIYPIDFLMPGYQIVFLKMLGGPFEKGQVLEEALVALARQVVTTGKALGVTVTEEAFDFAKRMVAYSSSSPPIRSLEC
jgi:hypothetical protein